VRRREFIIILGTGAAWPLAARAQKSAPIARMGYLGPTVGNPVTSPGYAAFLDQLRKLGITHGQNLLVEHRHADQETPGPFVGAVELVASKVGLILVVGPELYLKAAIAASTTVPIVVFAVNYDPIALGYVESLPRPGGRITGVFSRHPELAGKQLELMTEAFPDRRRVAILWDTQTADQLSVAERVAKSLRVEQLPYKMETYDFDAAFQNLAVRAPQMLLVLSSPLFTPQRSRIAELAIQYRLPTMFIFKNYVEAGGLMSYGVDTIAMWRRVASFVAAILRGAKPADLPLEQATKFELVVNLKTAKALGLTIPPTLLARADEVIE
jgi:putative tryptophan/tyrosine transport system substrate-binding protein